MTIRSFNIHMEQDYGSYDTPLVIQVRLGFKKSFPMVRVFRRLGLPSYGLVPDVRKIIRFFIQENDIFAQNHLKNIFIFFSVGKPLSVRELGG